MATKLGPHAMMWLHRIGTFLGLAGIVFVGHHLHAYASDIDFRGLGFRGFVALVALSVVYGSSNLLLAAGWRCLLDHSGAQVSASWAIRTYAVSQLAKYVPGNIFHFAGRQAIGLAAGIDNMPLAKSTALELGFFVGGALLFFPLVVPLVMRVPIWAGNIFFVLAVLLAIRAASHVGRRDFRDAALFYLTFLFLSGLVFVATYALGAGTADMKLYPSVAGAYVLAWLAGLVTPGAPAGLGVREAVLLFLLDGLDSDETILLAVVMGRAVTVLGDLGFYLLGGKFAGRTF